MQRITPGGTAGSFYFLSHAFSIIKLGSFSYYSNIFFSIFWYAYEGYNQRDNKNSVPVRVHTVLVLCTTVNPVT